MVTKIPLKGNTKGVQLIVVETILIALDFIAVGLRLWARSLKRKNLELNDYTLIAALFLMTARYVNEVLVVILGGLGLHITDVLKIGGIDIVQAFGKMAFADDLLWLALVALIKISILDLYKSIFRNATFLRVANGVLSLCTVTAVALILERCLICRPVAYNWDTTIKGTCGNIEVQYIAIVSIDLIIDVVLITLPMPVLWRLQMSRIRKIAIMAIFGLGFLICALTAVRLKFVLELQYNDSTYSLAEFRIFAALEPLLGIINACLPVLPPVFPNIFNHVSLTSSRIFARLKNASHERPWRRQKSVPSGISATQSSGDPDGHPLIDVSREDPERQDSRAIKVTTDWTVRSNTKIRD